MPKFFSKFSKRKLIPVVSALLIVAIGVPLLTRQFWVMDADSNTFSSSSADEIGSLTEVSKDQLVKSKQYAKLMIDYIKARPATDDQEVLSQRLADLIKYSAIDQEINSDGYLVITPNISYQSGIKYLGELKNQVLVLAQSGDDTTKSTLNQISGELDKSIKIFGNKDFKSANQVATIKPEFLRISDVLSSKANTIKDDNTKNIITEASGKLKAFPANDADYLAAINAYATLYSYKTQIVDIDQQLGKMIANVAPLLRNSDNSVAYNSSSSNDAVLGMIEQAAAETQTLPPSPYSAKKLTFTTDEFNSFRTEGQAILTSTDANKYKTPQDKYNAVGSLAYDKLHPNRSSTDNTKDKQNFIKNYGTDMAALASFRSQGAGIDAVKYDIMFAYLWTGATHTAEYAGTAPGTVAGDQRVENNGIYFDTLIAMQGARGWDNITAEAQKLGYDISQIHKTSDGLLGVRQQVSEAPTDTSASLTSFLSSLGQALIGKLKVQAPSGSAASTTPLPTDTDALAALAGRGIFNAYQLSTLENDPDKRALEEGNAGIEALKKAGYSVSYINNDPDKTALEAGQAAVNAINVKKTNDTEYNALLSAYGSGAEPGVSNFSQDQPIADSEGYVAAEEELREQNMTGAISGEASKSTSSEDIFTQFNNLLSGYANLPTIIAQTNVAVTNLLHNNLTDSYFGNLYLDYLNNAVSYQTDLVYNAAKQFCQGSLQNSSIQPDTMTNFCNQVVSTWVETPVMKAAAKNPNPFRSELKGSLSMDPRTQHMVYTTTVAYFDKNGKPNIAGSMTFDPISNQVSGDLTKSFGDSRVTLYSDAFTGDLYVEYSNITKPLAQIGKNGNILTLQTITVSKNGQVGGTFQLFHHLLNYNPNTKEFEVKITRDGSPYNLWVNTKGEVRGSYNVNIGKTGVSVGVIIDSKGNFTIPVSYAKNGTTYGSVWIGQDGNVAGQINLGKTIGNNPLAFVGFDKNGISSVGLSIGNIKGSPFSFSIARDGSLSFGGFVPVGGLPVPVALGQDAHGNITLSWPGGHWTLGSENRPINAPAPKLKADKSGYDGGTIWYHHSFKKGWKLVRVYNVINIKPDEQKMRGDMIFKKYNELLKRNPSISEFLNWYFYNGHGMSDDGIMLSKAADAGQKRTDYLGTVMTTVITKNGYQPVTPAYAKFPNLDEYKWIQAGNNPEEFAKRPTDLTTVNPFDPEVFAAAQQAASDPTSANLGQAAGNSATQGQSMQQITNAINASIKQDSDYAQLMARFASYFKDPTGTSTGTSDASNSAFIAAPSN